MKRLTHKLIIILFISIYIPMARAGGSVEHSAKALEMSLEAIGHSTIAGLKLVSGAVAVPLTFAGEVGKVSGDVGHDLWEEANTTESDAFPVSDEVVTAGPAPDKQLEQGQK